MGWEEGFIIARLNSIIQSSNQIHVCIIYISMKALCEEESLMDSAEPVTEKTQPSSVHENDTLITDIGLQSEQADRSLKQSYVIQLSDLKTYIKNKSRLQFDDEFQVGCLLASYFVL